MNPYRTVDILKGSVPGHEDQVAVVVPTKNSGRTLEACLRSLRDQRFLCVIVVVDNHSTDDTIAIAFQYADIVSVAGPERSAQRNAGAALTTSPILGFIDSDMVVESTVVEQATSALLSGAGGIVVPEHSFGEGFWADVRRFERSFYHGSDSVEAARFFRRDVFESVGGFDEAMEPGAEDWDLTIRVREVAAVTRISAEIAHDEGRPTFWNACAKKGYYAPGLRSFARKHGSASLSVLDRPYLRRPWMIFAQGPRLGLGLVALKTGEATAVVAATVLHSGPLSRRSGDSVDWPGTSDGSSASIGRSRREGRNELDDSASTESPRAD
ncbi:MAG: glycosyltransferase family 2 protein [Candidatus Dormibacteria bacterium]